MTSEPTAAVLTNTRITEVINVVEGPRVLAYSNTKARTSLLIKQREGPCPGESPIGDGRTLEAPHGLCDRAVSPACVTYQGGFTQGNIAVVNNV